MKLARMLAGHSRFSTLGPRWLALGTVAFTALMLSPLAQAGDSVTAWQGFYLGAHLSRVDADYSVLGPNNPNAMVNSDHPFDQPGGAFYSLNLQEMSGGFQLGYNQRFSALLLGVEVEYTHADERKVVRYSPGVPTSGDFVDVTVNSPLTFSGRLAYPAGRFLPYLKAGITRMTYQATAGDLRDLPPNFPRDLSDQTFLRERDTVFSYGLGLEYLLHPDWSLKLEYTRVNSGKFRTGNQDGNGQFFIHDFDKIELIKLGVNFRF